jgi:hypothetical protein
LELARFLERFVFCPPNMVISWQFDGHVRGYSPISETHHPAFAHASIVTRPVSGGAPATFDHRARRKKVQLRRAGRNASMRT